MTLRRRRTPRPSAATKRGKHTRRRSPSTDFNKRSPRVPHSRNATTDTPSALLACVARYCPVPLRDDPPLDAQSPASPSCTTTAVYHASLWRQWTLWGVWDPYTARRTTPFASLQSVTLTSAKVAAAQKNPYLDPVLQLHLKCGRAATAVPRTTRGARADSAHQRALAKPTRSRPRPVAQAVAALRQAQGLSGRSRLTVCPSLEKPPAVQCIAPIAVAQRARAFQRGQHRLGRAFETLIAADPPNATHRSAIPATASCAAGACLRHPWAIAADVQADLERRLLREEGRRQAQNVVPAASAAAPTPDSSPNSSIVAAIVRFAQLVVHQGRAVEDVLADMRSAGEWLAVPPRLPLKRPFARWGTALLSPYTLRDPTFRRDCGTLATVARAVYHKHTPSHLHTLLADTVRVAAAVRVSDTAREPLTERVMVPQRVAVATAYPPALPLSNLSNQLLKDDLFVAQAWAEWARDRSERAQVTPNSRTHTQIRPHTRGPASRGSTRAISNHDAPAQRVHMRTQKIRADVPSLRSPSSHRTLSLVVSTPPAATHRPNTRRMRTASPSPKLKPTQKAKSTPTPKPKPAPKPTPKPTPKLKLTPTPTPKLKLTPTPTPTPKSIKLLSAEVDTYVAGLKAHLKDNGDKSYVRRLQAAQRKRVPAFDFSDIVPPDHAHHATLMKKLKASAKNRNVLREAKRRVLRAYGAYNTSKRGGNALATRNGALYTRKNPHREGGDELPEEPLRSGSMIKAVDTDKVSWGHLDSLGHPLTDDSAHDLAAQNGISQINLNDLGGPGGLKTVVV